MPTPDGAASADWAIRDYRDEDEPSWLRCRVLSFLDSTYYDDVKTTRTTFDAGSKQLVAVHAKPEGLTTPGNEEVIGILDVELPESSAEDGTAAVATIDTIAVHPDHLRCGIADALLLAALDRLSEHNVSGLDAWTRDDEAANGWYLKAGFTEEHRYVHVYKGWDEPDDGWASPEGLSAPVMAFARGSIEDLDDLRARHDRVHVCRQYLLPLSG